MCKERCLCRKLFLHEEIGACTSSVSTIYLGHRPAWFPILAAMLFEVSQFAISQAHYAVPATSPYSTHTCVYQVTVPFRRYSRLNGDLKKHTRLMVFDGRLRSGTSLLTPSSICGICSVSKISRLCLRRKRTQSMLSRICR